MPISVRCQCGKQYKVDEKLAGKKLRCKACDTVLAIKRPAKTKRASPADEDEMGFLDMDLDSEFSNFDEVKQVRPRPVQKRDDTPQFLDPTGPPPGLSQRIAQRELEGAGPVPDGVETSAKIIGGILGVLLGIGLITAGILLRINLGLGNRVTYVFLGAGVASLLGGLGWMFGSGGNTD